MQKDLFVLYYTEYSTSVLAKMPKINIWRAGRTTVTHDEEPCTVSGKRTVYLDI